MTVDIRLIAAILEETVDIAWNVKHPSFIFCLMRRVDEFK